MCCPDGCTCSRKCCKKIPIKRYFLPLTAVFALTGYEEMRVFTYLPIVVFAGFFIIFWNFPWMVFYTASKPLYYEDLFIDEKRLPNYDVDPKVKNKFQAILIWVLIVTNALLTAALSDYWLYKTAGKESWLEIIGVTGGIIKIFQIVNNTISRLMLKVLRRCVKSENTRLKAEQRDAIEKIIRLKKVQSGVFRSLELTNAPAVGETKRDPPVAVNIKYEMEHPVTF